jgi:hypothetical protein
MASAFNDLLYDTPNNLANSSNKGTLHTCLITAAVREISDSGESGDFHKLAIRTWRCRTLRPENEWGQFPAVHNPWRFLSMLSRDSYNVNLFPKTQNKFDK